MTVDKEEHRDVLLQLITKATFPGEFAEKVVELKEALKAAKVAEPEAQ